MLLDVSSIQTRPEAGLLISCNPAIRFDNLSAGCIYSLKLTSYQLCRSWERENISVKQGLVTKTQECSEQRNAKYNETNDVEDEGYLPHCGEGWRVGEDALGCKRRTNVVPVDNRAFVVDTDGGVHAWCVVILERSNSWNTKRGWNC
jgi:hypothetical protein